MKASSHPAYEACVRGYAKQVGSADAPQSPANSLAYGMLVGCCMALDIDHLSEPVREDVRVQRRVFWSPATFRA